MPQHRSTPPCHKWQPTTVFNNQHLRLFSVFLQKEPESQSLRTRSKILTAMWLCRNLSKPMDFEKVRLEKASGSELSSMPASHMQMPGFLAHLHLRSSFFLMHILGGSKWQGVSLAPGFSLPQVQLLQASGVMNHPMDRRSLFASSPPLSLFKIYNQVGAYSSTLVFSLKIWQHQARFIYSHELSGKAME